MAIYAIGDIHGCYNALTRLFDEISPQQEDTFVFLGDYVDSGPDTKKVLDWLINFMKENQCIFLRGNHEIMMMEGRENNENFKNWCSSGGTDTLASYGICTKNGWVDTIGSCHWEFIENTLPYWQIDDYIFVHAGLEPCVPLEEQNEHTLFWKKFKEPPMYSPTKQVICGHTSRKKGKIANFEHTVCIDTYAYGGKWLTCLNVETGTFIQANQEKQAQKGQL